MKPRIEVLLAIFLFGGIVSFRLIRPSAGVTDGNRMGIRPAADVAMAGEGSSYSYVGSFRCKKCHLGEHKSWEATKMAKSLDILKPCQHKEAKEKFKIDVGKDYTKEASCLKCHTTGFQRPGGYAPPGKVDEVVCSESSHRVEDPGVPA